MASPDDSLAAAHGAARWAVEQRGVFEQRLRRLVDIDSGLDAPDGRREVTEQLAVWGEAAGCIAEHVETAQGTDLVLRLEGCGRGRVVLLGHHDTVFERGTASARPCRFDGACAFGPGVADMKGGLLVGLLAMEALAAAPRLFEAVELRSVPDEETRTVAPAGLDDVRGADAVLVLECGRENGDVVVGRKTAAWVRLEVKGRAAHAGTESHHGRNAVVGLSREVLRCDALNRRRQGLTVVPGTIIGGSLPNVVPESAAAALDVRAVTSTDLAWALARIAEVRLGDGLSATVDVSNRWPGIEPNAGTQLLFRHAQAIADDLGFAVGGQTSGGMSDGCWTAGAGVPTLDGLGPIGGRDHSPGEYILLDSVPDRCGLIAGLCVAVGGGLLSDLSGAEGGGVANVGRP